jgi:hypothetical protein
MRSVGAVVLIAVVALAACGDEARTGGTRDDAGGQTDRQAVKRALLRALTGREAPSRCERGVTHRLIAEIYGTLARCLEVEAPDPRKPRPTGLRVQDMRVHAQRATVRVTLHGGLTPGASGHVELVRTAGSWKLDRVGTDFLRAQIASTLLRQIRLTASRPGLHEGAARHCVEERISRIPEHRFRTLAAAATAENADASRPLVDLITFCLAQPGTGPSGQSYLRAQLEKQVLSFVRREGGDGAALTCARRRLRTEISDKEILDHVKRNKAAPPAATKRIATIVEDCLA